MARLGAIFFILIGFCVNAHAVDNSITILGVTLPRENSSKAIAQLQTLADNWSNEFGYMIEDSRLVYAK
jgi:hypothetical protein